jgi:putative transposase
VETATEKVRVYKMVAYQWQDRWNRNGYISLKPRFAGGKPSKFSPVKIERLISILDDSDDFTTNDVEDFIGWRFAIRFGQKHTCTILGKSA